MDVLSAVATSDQKVSLRRSSKGKSKRVASIWVVSSMDTLSTQSKGSPMGRLSRVFWMRLRISGSIMCRFCGETIGLTVLRCMSCLGWSMAMNMGRVKSSSGSNRVIAGSEEKTPWLVSTAMMSLYLVTDQKGPCSWWPSGWRWTGSSFRRRSK